MGIDWDRVKELQARHEVAKRSLCIAIKERQDAERDFGCAKDQADSWERSKVKAWDDLVAAIDPPLEVAADEPDPDPAF